MPGSNSFQVVRAVAEKFWTKTGKGPHDYSDHHPCEWEVDDLKGVTYNVQFLPRLLGEDGKKNKADVVAAAKGIAAWLSKDVRYDVMCLQEVFDDTAAQTLDTELAKQGYVVTKRLGGTVSSATSGGVRIYVKQALEHLFDENGLVYQHKVDFVQGGDALVAKGIKHVQFMKGEKRYHVLNTHLQASYNDKKDMTQSRQHYVEVALAQLLELKAYIEAQKDNGVIFGNDVIVVCGDFNIPRDAKGEPEKLDAVSKRGNALFERAKILLGPGFQLVDSTAEVPAGMPTSSFDPATNAYLQTSNEPMSAKLDLVFSVSAKPIASTHPALDIFVSELQLALCSAVQKIDGILTHQFSNAEQKRIADASKALDGFIAKPCVANVKDLLAFSSTLPLKRRVEINAVLMDAIEEKAPKDSEMRATIMEDTFTMFLGKRDALKGSAFVAMQKLRETLLKEWTNFYAADSTVPSEKFKENCKVAINAATKTLQKHRGFYQVMQWLGSVLVMFGTAIKSPEMIRQGQSYLNRPTDSMRIVGLFQHEIEKLPSSNVVPKNDRH